MFLAVASPPRVLERSCLVRFDQKESPKLKFAFLAYIFNRESLKAAYSEIQLVSSFLFSCLASNLFLSYYFTSYFIIISNEAFIRAH